MRPPMTPLSIDLAVVTALPEEAAPLRSAYPEMTHGGNPEAPWIAGRTAAGLDLVVAVTGAGKVAAARGIERLLSRFRPSLLVAAGIAGGIDPGVQPGYLVCATAVTTYDQDATAVGFPLGTFLRGVPAIVPIPGPPGVPDPPSVLSRTLTQPVFPGMIATGDTVVTERTIRALPETWRARIHEAVAVDMEGAVWVEAAISAGVPVVLLRVVSDHLSQGTRQSFSEISRSAGESALRIVEACRRGPDGAIVIR